MTENDQNMEIETEVTADEEPEEFDEDEESEDLSVVEKIMGVFVSPVSTFQYLAKKPDFWTPFILLTLFGITAGFLIMPVITQGGELAMAEAVSQATGSDEEAEQGLAIAKKITGIAIYVGVFIGTPINVAIQCLIITALIFFIGMFQGMDVSFKRLIGVMPWTLVLPTIGSIINALMIMDVKITDVDMMKDVAFMKPFSLAGILPESLNLPVSLSTLAASIEPFTIWAWILVVFAVEAANRCNRSKAIATTIIYILISLVIGAGLAQAGAALQPS